MVNIPFDIVYTIGNINETNSVSLNLEGIGGGGGGVNLISPPLNFFGFKFLFLDRLPKALAQLFFVC